MQLFSVLKTVTFKEKMFLRNKFFLDLRYFNKLLFHNVYLLIVKTIILAFIN